MNFYFYQYFEVMALIVAIAYFKGLRHFGIGLFLVLLLLDNITEIAGNNFQHFSLSSSYFIDNLYLIISTPLQLFLFLKMLRLKGSPLILFRCFSLLLFVLILLDFFFVEGQWSFNSFSLILIEVANIIFSCLVLFRISMDERTTPSLFYHPFFWINAAILLFSIMALVLLGLQHYLRVQHIELGKRTLYYAILPTANIALYLGYSYGFILCQLQKPKS